MNESSGGSVPVEGVIGYRAWRPTRGGRLRSTGAGHTTWKRGVNSAACAGGLPHASPARDCACGLYAFHEPPVATRPGVVGAVRVHGRLEVHRDGFRAEHAEIVALAHSGRRPGRRAARAGARYGVPLVSLERLEAHAREHGEPIPPSWRPAPDFPRSGAVADAARAAYLRVAVPLRHAPRARAAALFAVAYAPLITFVLWSWLALGVDDRLPALGSVLVATLPALLSLVADSARRTLGSGWPLPGTGGWSMPTLLSLAAPLELAWALGADGRALDTAAVTIGLLAVGVIGAGVLSMHRPLLVLSSGAVTVAVMIALAALDGHALAILAVAGLLQCCALSGRLGRFMGRVLPTPARAWAPW